ncbi:unnamed protein product [Pleuronectes platessa]|uniref:Uncharacterized protein n=1 Tax=Pleuronectes platessa TaxID=8262 RepID=A0A9N7ZBF9_PLEPL|nr:unnamed protein product [Pleuronectes platessa]
MGPTVSAWKLNFVRVWEEWSWWSESMVARWRREGKMWPGQEDVMIEQGDLWRKEGSDSGKRQVECVHGQLGVVSKAIAREGERRGEDDREKEMGRRRRRTGVCVLLWRRNLASSLTKGRAVRGRSRETGMALSPRRRTRRKRVGVGDSVGGARCGLWWVARGHTSGMARAPSVTYLERYTNEALQGAGRMWKWRSVVIPNGYTHHDGTEMVWSLSDSVAGPMAIPCTRIEQGSSSSVVPYPSPYHNVGEARTRGKGVCDKADPNERGNNTTTGIGRGSRWTRGTRPGRRQDWQAKTTRSTRRSRRGVERGDSGSEAHGGRQTNEVPTSRGPLGGMCRRGMSIKPHPQRVKDGGGPEWEGREEVSHRQRRGPRSLVARNI